MECLKDVLVYMPAIYLKYPLVVIWLLTFKGTSPWDLKLEEEVRKTENLETVRCIKTNIKSLTPFTGLYFIEKWIGWTAQNKNGVFWNKNEANNN